MRVDDGTAHGTAVLPTFFSAILDARCVQKYAPARAGGPRLFAIWPGLWATDADSMWPVNPHFARPAPCNNSERVQHRSCYHATAVGPWCSGGRRRTRPLQPPTRTVAARWIGTPDCSSASNPRVTAGRRHPRRPWLTMPPPENPPPQRSSRRRTGSSRRHRPQLCGTSLRRSSLLLTALILARMKLTAMTRHLLRRSTTRRGWAPARPPLSSRSNRSAISSSPGRQLPWPLLVLLV